MKELSIVYVVLLLILSPSCSWAFDCTKAFLPVDFVICSNSAVMQANEDHEKAWFATKANLNEAQKETLLENQRQWLKQFPPKCGIPTKGKRPEVITPKFQQCVIKTLQTRTAFLQQYSDLLDTAKKTAKTGDTPKVKVTKAKSVSGKFNCKNAKQQLDLIICSSSDLLMAEAKLERAYRIAKNKLADEESKKQLAIRFKEEWQHLASFCHIENAEPSPTPELITGTHDCILSVLTYATANFSNEKKILKGVISRYECGDNCYLIIKDASSGKEHTGLCTASLCQEWNEAVDMPAKFKGKKVRIIVGIGLQLDGGDNVMGEMDTFEKIELLK
jgi:uncharacterized protein YecT (DUF1311 family)